MKTFKPEITLIRNARRCYILDTVKGCSACSDNNPRGCYGDCYAKNIASRYNIDFSNPINRDFYKDKEQLMFFDFYDTKHINKIIRQIKLIKMPFIRIGEMGDPSEDWEHTINVCEVIAHANKPIVIITKHWKTIPDWLLDKIKTMNICINTSISALDNDIEIKHRINQYKRLKTFCKSILRIVSCDFNTDNSEGKARSEKQDELFDNANIIDTVFRPSKNNPFVENHVINVKPVRFLRNTVLASVRNSNPYLGYCDTCPDMCGAIKD